MAVMSNSMCVTPSLASFSTDNSLTSHVGDTSYISYTTEKVTLTLDPDMKKQFGADQANNLLLFESRHLSLFSSLVAKEGISCSFHVTSAYDVCTTPVMAVKGKAAFHERRQDFPEAMAPYLELRTPEEVQRLSGVKDGLWGCVYKVGSIHPYDFANGLMERALVMSREGGGSINVQTRTSVLSVKHDSTWTVETDRGNVTTPKVLLATNAYTSFLLPEMAEKIVPICEAVASFLPPPEPKAGTPSLERMRPFSTSYSLKYSPGLFDYMISRQEGKREVVLGGAQEVYVDDRKSWMGTVDDNKILCVGSEQERRRKVVVPFIIRGLTIDLE